MRGHLWLTVEADGDPAPSYQWLRISEDGSSYSIPYATLARYRVDNASTSDSGFYAVSVSNYLGTVISETVYVSVERVITRPSNDDFVFAHHSER